MERLFRSVGWSCQRFASVDDFLATPGPSQSGCVISDIRMPGRSALDLPASLVDSRCSMPVIFITADDTPEHRAAAKRVGAAGYFRKPVDDQALLDVIVWALSSGCTPPETEAASFE